MRSPRSRARCLLLQLALVTSSAVKYTSIRAGRGRVTVQYPSRYSSSTAHPLVVLLPGYSDGYPWYSHRFGLTSQIDAQNLVVVWAAGRTDAFNSSYWMAWGDWTGICDLAANYSDAYFYDAQKNVLRPDSYWASALTHCGGAFSDVAYVRKLITMTQAKFHIDPAQVAVLGHSNGGGMAYRMACAAADLITAAVVVEGAPPPDRYNCTPSQPVRLLHVHGTADDCVLYMGHPTYDGAVGSCERWLRFNACPVQALAHQPAARQAAPGRGGTALALIGRR